MTDLTSAFNRLSLGGNQESNSRVQLHVQAGVLLERGEIEASRRYYECTVCGKCAIFDAPSHIQKTEHLNSLTWDVIKEEDPSPALLSLLPAEVRLAKEQGNIEAVDRSFFLFQCKICQGKKNPVCGCKPLLQHLIGNGHRKEIERRRVMGVISREPSNETPTEKFIDLSREVRRETPRDSPLPQTKPICGTDITLSLRMAHDEAQRRLHAVASRHTTHIQSMAKDTLNNPKTNVEVENNKRLGIVTVREKTPTYTSYYCNACQVPLTGEEPLREHVRGRSHKRKTAEIDSLIVNSEDLKPPPALPTAVPIVRAFPWRVKSAHEPRQPGEGVYKNLSIPRGIVNVFNYYFSDSENVRHGATVDTLNLKALFGKLGYHVKLHEDLSKDTTIERLEAIRTDKELSQYDSFIMIFLSHGQQDTMFYTKDHQMVSLEDVRYFFVDGKCPQLREKPKLFLANFCRGDLSESNRLEYDSGKKATTEAPKDMLTIYASIKNFRAQRDKVNGTVFVQTLCEVLAAHAHELELQDLYLKLCETMKRKEGTTPESQNYYFKKFFFNPLSAEEL